MALAGFNRADLFSLGERHPAHAEVARLARLGDELAMRWCAAFLTKEREEETAERRVG